MLLYMVYEKTNGRIVHVHRTVDAAGRSCACTEEEVMRVLPAHIDAKSVGIASTEVELVPSGRQTMFGVHVPTGAVVKTPVAAVPPKEVE